MGNFEKLSVLVIVVIIVMILVVALYTWTDKPSEAIQADSSGSSTETDMASGDYPEPDYTEPSPWSDPDEEIVNLDDLAGESLEGEDEREDVGDVVVGDDETNGDTEAITADATTSDDPSALEEWVYEVQKGDTIGHIAMRELGTIRRQNEIYDMNPGLDALRLQIGQKLRMPARGTQSGGTAGGGEIASTSTGAAPVPGAEYVTQRGDQLRTIAKRAYNDWERWPEIFAKNWGVIDDPERVPPGVKIFIPK